MTGRSNAVRSSEQFFDPLPETGDVYKYKRFDIIAGAIRNDVKEVAGAVEIDGTSINYRDEKNGLTALHRASARGNLRVIFWLVSRAENDLDIFILDSFGRTAADLAARCGQDAVLDILLPLMYPSELSQ